MTKSGAHTLTTSYAAVQNWAADTSNYPGSTVSSHGIVVQGSNTNATIAASCPYTSSLGCTVALRLFKNGSQVAQGSTTASGTSGTATVSLTGQTVSNGDVFTIQAIASNNFGSISAGTSTWVRVT